MEEEIQTEEQSAECSAALSTLLKAFCGEGSTAHPLLKLSAFVPIQQPAGPWGNHCHNCRRNVWKELGKNSPVAQCAKQTSFESVLIYFKVMAFKTISWLGRHFCFLKASSCIRNVTLHNYFLKIFAENVWQRANKQARLTYSMTASCFPVL